MKTAVIAGTPVDTRMGLDYLNRKDPQMETLYLPCADTPRACHVFQMASAEEKSRQMRTVFEKALADGADRFFIYCNSLSTTVDFPSLAAALNVRCVTPLDAYALLADRYGCVGLIAANNQATAGIEKVFTDRNPSCYVFGTGFLKLVEDIEKGFRREGADYEPEAIVARRGLAELCAFYERNGAEALVIGCTHFPYIREALARQTRLPIIDPADVMYELLVR